MSDHPRKPALLYVPCQPSQALPIAEFHDWYNNEHGPLRLRLSTFHTGVRYRAIDSETPEWLALYDMESAAAMQAPEYVRLLQRSERETKILAQLDVLDRRIFERISERGKEVEQEGPSAELVSVQTDIDPEDEDEFNRWYEEEHVGLLALIPGWEYSRRYRLVDSTGTGTPTLKYLALHGYAAQNGRGGPEHKHAMSTSWRNEVHARLRATYRRTYALHYAFGPAPRDLAAGAVESVVDGPSEVGLHYRLEGSPDESAHTVVFLHSLLTDLRVWDETVARLLDSPAPLRLLRVDMRGHGQSTLGKTAEVNFDILADDVIAVLDALRVTQPVSLVGVSIGGVIALAAAARHPSRVARVLAADCNIASSEASKSAWHARIALAQEQGIPALADETLARWFTPNTTANTANVRTMILGTSHAGFEAGAHALSAFDLRTCVQDLRVPVRFVVGAQDGTLPGAMREFAAQEFHGAKVVEVRGAGHLPMVENIAGWQQVLEDWLDEGAGRGEVE